MYWKIKLNETKEQLEANNFEVTIADGISDAKTIVLEKLIPQLKPQRISWGGSMTFVASGLYQALKDAKDMEVVDAIDLSLSKSELMERKRASLMVDLFITGTNAITEDGQLVNLDMIGNRVGALTFGPKHVIVLVGRNKIVPDIEDAMARIKDFAAPANAMRLDKKTPCSKTAYCHECNSPDRICNTWTITEKSFPKHRVKIVLINEAVGL
ncbi:MAG: lactate utilization protein [Deltaproteobacteria bacterium]|nr:MAG: lactate utilization protein [Deltaproteobacteria bacterium]RLC13453.1 MAG: lactate utilization protein [Deltaproteobacteria bacterium]